MNRYHWLHGPVDLLKPGNTLQNITSKLHGKTKPRPKAFVKKQSIMECSPRLPQDTKSLIKKLPWKSNEDASQKSSWNETSLPMYQGHQTASAQFLQ